MIDCVLILDCNGHISYISNNTIDNWVIVFSSQKEILNIGEY